MHPLPNIVRAARAARIAFRLAAACLLLAAAPARAEAYSVASPHWPHIRVSDLARQLRSVPVGARRDSAYAWYARHVDRLQVSMDTFHRNIAVHESVPMKAVNPTLRTYGYDFDVSICQHVDCTHTSPLDTVQASMPEAWYLHFSEDTRIAFYAIDAVTPVATVDIPGCPDPQPLSPASRVQMYMWDDQRWLPHMGNPGWRAWYADHLLDEMTHDRFGAPDTVNGLFLDEHGVGFSNTYGIGYQAIILSGGAIREYGNLRPHDQRQWQFDALDSLWNEDATGWLTYLRGRLDAVGRFAQINTAEYFMDPHAFQQNVAINGVFTEMLHAPTHFRQGAAQYARFVRQVRQLVQAGGTVDLAYTPCDFGPPEYTAGNYATAKARFQMWNLASYYMVREMGDEPGTAWFDPNLCIDPGGADPLSFEREWLPAYEVDPGQPVDTATVIARGVTPCTQQEFAVFARHYTHATVLVRPRDDYNCTDYGTSTAAFVVLQRPMRRLEPDGTLSASMSSLLLRNAEAVILVPADDRTSPATLDDVEIH